MFEWTFRDPRKLAAFFKSCDALTLHSDTAMLKVRKQGVSLMVTDFESFCAVEVRVTENLFPGLRVTAPTTAKILLTSLVGILRQIIRNKHVAVWHSETDGVLHIREAAGESLRTVTDHLVESTENRPRVFFPLSTQRFKEQGEYAEFRLANAELNRIVNTHAILSGTCGGVTDITVGPVENDRCDIRFSTGNQGGGWGAVTIHTHPRSESVPLVHRPAAQISIQIFLTYLKRSQHFLLSPMEMVTVSISNRGLLLNCDHGDHSVMVFTVNVSGEDLKSYV